jgi:hypothetical protein
MIRTCSALIVVIAGTALTGCNDSMNAMGDRSGTPQEAVRFDQNGNKIYDPSVRNTRSEDMGRSWDGGSNRDEWNSGNGRWTNDRQASSNDSRYTQDDRRSMRSDQDFANKWRDQDVTIVQTSELPQPVLTTFQRQSGGAELTETGWANHDGRKCYCSKIRKDGVTYKMISDADGNLLAMKRID